MALFDRLVGYGPGFVGLQPGEVKLPIHSFIAGMAEGYRGVVTRAQFITAFGIQPSEEAYLDALWNKGAGLAANRRDVYRIVMHDCLLLGETRHAYTVEANFTSRMQNFT
jgi:hypothetical protein